MMGKHSLLSVSFSFLADVLSTELSVLVEQSVFLFLILVLVLSQWPDLRSRKRVPFFFFLLGPLKLQLLQSNLPHVLTSVWYEAGSNVLLSCREIRFSCAFCRRVSFLCGIPFTPMLKTHQAQTQRLAAGLIVLKLGREWRARLRLQRLFNATAHSKSFLDVTRPLGSMP